MSLKGNADNEAVVIQAFHVLWLAPVILLNQLRMVFKGFLTNPTGTALNGGGGQAFN